ncbi:hypothetical protein IJS77_03995 [bacterium]|nr:hypothetical protein [bacterium]
MIIKDFSDYLKENYKNGKKTVELLSIWIKEKIENPPKSLVDKVIQKEIYLAKNKNGEFFLIGKSDSGRILINALFNFALSFEQQDYARKIHNLKSSNIK